MDDLADHGLRSFYGLGVACGRPVANITYCRTFAGWGYAISSSRPTADASSVGNSRRACAPTLRSTPLRCGSRAALTPPVISCKWHGERLVDTQDNADMDLRLVGMEVSRWSISISP